MLHHTSLQATPIIHHLPVVASTNEAAAIRLDEGAETPFWIVADRQTAGRGRQGRRWQEGTGNLYASTGRRLPLTGAKLATIALVTAVAVHDAISHSCNRPLPLTLKWPNDILVNNAKLGGILIESQQDRHTGESQLVIGIGLNIAVAPPVEDRETTSLHALNHLASRDDIFTAIIGSFEHWLTRWHNAQNLDEIITAWTERAAPLGTEITVRTGANRATGTFAGLDESGALRLRLPDNRLITVTSGELS